MPIYPQLVKLVAPYFKSDSAFPPAGLGGKGDTEGDRVIWAINASCQHYIHLAVFDEISAIDGSCPLELIADASGIAWGGAAYQMVRDLSKFKVLMTGGKGLTPTQQAWDPRTLESYAQLGSKRAAVAMLGQIRALLWTDHANTNRLLTAIYLDVKHLRWISEIVADVSGGPTEAAAGTPSSRLTSRILLTLTYLISGTRIRTLCWCWVSCTLMGKATISHQHTSGGGIGVRGEAPRYRRPPRSSTSNPTTSGSGSSRASKSGT